MLSITSKGSINFIYMKRQFEVSLLENLNLLISLFNSNSA